MITTLLRISWTNLKRDRVAQALTFLLPILFFSIFASVFGNQGGNATSRVRIAVVDELSKDYVRAARARGLSLGSVVRRHVLRNAAIPVVTIAALEMGNLLAGSVIVEAVFAWPGIGQLAIQSIQSRDFLVAQAVVLFVSIVYVLLNLLTDFVYAWIDPRIRMGGA